MTNIIEKIKELELAINLSKPFSQQEKDLLEPMVVQLLKNINN